MMAKNPKKEIATTKRSTQLILGNLKFNLPENDLIVKAKIIKKPKN